MLVLTDSPKPVLSGRRTDAGPILGSIDCYLVD